MMLNCHLPSLQEMHHSAASVQVFCCFAIIFLLRREASHRLVFGPLHLQLSQYKKVESDESLRKWL